MSDEGDKTCPLCAEEMDLTDQQLKPCRCGYEICVWCWHHIMEMAEKEETDGCCPACRKPYDKERIVGTGANCERLVAEINMEKKHKSQKAKSKPSENRKQLSSVRVIQKNLVYIVGLPLDLADEDILQSKDYFSQYGKVLKVSISRTSAGTIQQFPNNTCSVYITYGKEEEAVRCIQSVHGFILDGRPLRVCFGTTKYCHAWLRNMPCSNPDCLYLHEIGSQEDSFTKDEVISAYTRSRVQQITGYTNNTQRRAGNVLPPPADDYCNSNAPPVAKPVVKSSSNNSTSCTRVSPPTSSSGRSGALPPAASWGARASNANNPPAGALACSNGPTKQKSEIVSGSQPLSTTVSSVSQDKLSSSDGGKKLMTNEETHSRQTTKRKDIPDSSKHHTGRNTQTIATEVSPTSSGVSAVKPATQSPNPSVASNNGGDGHVLHNPTLSVDGRPCSPAADKSASIADEKYKNLYSDLSSLSIENRPEDEHSGAMRPNGLCLDNFLSAGNQRLQLHDFEEYQEHSTLVTDTSAVSAGDSALSSNDVCDWQSDAQAPVKQNPTSETEDDFDSQRLRDAIVVSQATMSSSSPLHFLSHLRGPSLQHVDNAYGLDYASNPPLANRVPDEVFSSVVSGASNGFLDNFVNHASGHGNPLSLLDAGQVNQVRKYKGVMPVVDGVPSTDFGESSIISNILDLDSWDESLTSQNLAKLLGEADKQEGSIKLGGPWKGQNSNQSRFSFARQEESRNHLYNFESPLSNIGQLANNHSVGQGFVENRDLYMGRLNNGFGLSQGNIEQSDMLTNGNSIFPSTSRSQISAPRPPPGFAAPSRPPPPPGFNLHERNDQTFEMTSGNHLPEASALLRNTYQSSPIGNISTNSNDIEFLDPAILAVGKGSLPSSVNNSSIDMRSNYHVQNPLSENESRLLLMQRSFSPHQNLRYNDVRDNFLPVNDVSGFNTVRHMEQSQVSNISPFSQFSLQQGRNTVMSNGHWDNWNEIPATNDSITDLLRNDRLGYSKFRMTSSGDIYNKGFRM